MSFSQSIRPYLFLAVGLVVGGAGVVLFKDSMPAKEGSPEERVRQLEVELKRSENRVIALEGNRRRSSARTVGDGLRDLKDAVASGQLISPDQILRAFQPMIRDVSPIFDRIRAKQEKQHIDSMVGELTRKYDLNPAQREALHAWFKQKVEDDARRFSELAGQEGTTLETLARESRGGRWDKGLDGFMETQLSGEKLKTFKIERFNEKSDRVQADADMRVARVDSIVQLDDKQRDQVFGIMARGSPDYEASMELGSPLTNKRNEEMLTVLRPDQVQAWEAEQRKLRHKAEVEAAEVGMTPPEGWDPLDDW